jgi:hypothetical protein
MANTYSQDLRERRRSKTRPAAVPGLPKPMNARRVARAAGAHSSRRREPSNDTNLYLLAAFLSDGGDLGFSAPVMIFPHDDYRKLILRLTFQTPRATLDLSHPVLFL